MKVLFFGRLKEVTGTGELEVDGFSSLEDLKKFLFEKYPNLKSEVFAIAVNLEVVSGNVNLKSEDEVAFLPPIAGG